ncbi:hypothetical protein FE844_027765 (plasmid) [Rhizobium indicum]|uniref:hypothetical protein n=1 Tax=Rhizobium indicum TaxID=2583231 RepID=UPI0011074C20|nr:hypothetical protein [Rhizobium indicum]QKK33347.1 hypothetical protein FE844_027765 [Rhizobium indicum]
MSIVLAVTITSAAIHVASRDYRTANKIISVGLLTLAIVSLHFTGMTAFKLTPIYIDDSYSNPAAMQAMALGDRPGKRDADAWRCVCRRREL